jgi:hypothetical protein
MRIGIGFTSLLLDLHKDILILCQLDEFRFGCKREHVIRDDGRLPMEVSWLNNELPHLCKGEGLTMDEVELAAFATWRLFERRIRELDSQGKVRYQAGNSWELAKKLLRQGHQVWLKGKWLEPQDAALV